MSCDTPEMDNSKLLGKGRYTGVAYPANEDLSDFLW